MREVSAGFAARLAAEATALALLWRIVRRDGVALGFTTHDRALWVDGIEYRPAPGMSPSAIQQSDGLDVSTMEVAGALSSDAISDGDLAAGLYDGAAVSLALVDWQAPGEGTMALARGAIGTVSREGAGFTAELRGSARAFEAVPVELLSPECRAEFGDRRCRVALAGWTRTATIGAVDGTAVALDGVDEAEGWFAYGRLRSLASGRDAEIMESDGGTLVLREAMALAAGDIVELRAGCDKRFATCRERFANAANFRGEPHVPGGDALMRYPGV